MIRTSTFALSALLAASLTSKARPAGDGAYPSTRPEATAYAETSRYENVRAFMRAAAAASSGASKIHLTTFGYTFEGRALPLAVAGSPDASAAAVRATGKTRVFIQGNIHAGEVEGKEALLWLLRSIARGERAAWFRNVVLLIAPIYNADGNERVSVANRGAQAGPVGGMGTRANAQGLNLNRDAMKLETAEARSLAKLLTDYDPHVAVDLHTTNGSDHGYYLTYELPGNPNTSRGIVDLMRNELFPAVTSAVKKKHGWDLFYYGGASTRGGERAWWGDLDLYKPRYTHTYFGIRNRLGILSETYSYASFEDRIKASYRFVEEIVAFSASRAAKIRDVVTKADSESIVGTEQAVRGRLARFPEPVPIVLAQTAEVRNPYVPDRPMRLRVNGSERVETMPHYGWIEATEASRAPRAFIVPATLPGLSASPPAPGPGGPPSLGGPPRPPMTRLVSSVVDRLEAHGIRFTRTAAASRATVERFRIATSTVDERDFEGHKLRTLTGAWETSAEVDLPAGSLVIPMDQPLARLAFLLLDPRSDDGLMAWNVLDPVLGLNPGPEHYPVYRTMESMAGLR